MPGSSEAEPELLLGFVGLEHDRAVADPVVGCWFVVFSIVYDRNGAFAISSL